MRERERERDGIPPQSGREEENRLMRKKSISSLSVSKKGPEHFKRGKGEERESEKETIASVKKKKKDRICVLPPCECLYF